MAFVAHCDALIIDLRNNHGGGPSMFARLASYLLPGGVTLLNLEWRMAGTRNYRTTPISTVPDVRDSRFEDRDIYVLTSRTFSVAEGFADVLQSRKRATVVGEVTAGGANGGGPYRLDDHFFAAIPMGRLVNPVTKTNWEGTGVHPDVVVPERDALTTAQRLALQRLIEKTTDAQAVEARKQALGRLGASR